jgi:4-amino-4-deoxy-L-arabinose transferase-like glycosyltransferase
VETNQPGHQPSTNPTLLTRIGWAILIVATLCVCYFSHLGAIGFVGPDEPRYAWIARDMAETGDWVTPRLYGKPWFEKPPLLYWGAALSFKLFGVSEAAARLPSAVSALLATLALAGLALRLYGAETARWLLLFLPTTVGVIGFSHAAATDMPFSAMLTIAMVAAAVVVRLGQETNGSVARDAAAGGALRPSSGQASPSPTKAWLALVCFGFFLGLAVLAKGPAGIILCGGSVFFWALFTKRWRDAVRLLHPAAIAAFCVTALPWYILCDRRNPDFFRVFIVEHNFKRYLTPEFQHIQPFWYYIPILLLAFIPWTIVLAGTAIHALRMWTRESPSQTALLFLCWAIFPVVFFSVSKSKLPGYILPAVPPVALLLTRRLFSSTRKTGLAPRWTGVSAGLVSLVLLLACERLPFAIDYFPPQPLGWVLSTFFVAGVFALIYGVRRRPEIAFLATVGAVIVALALTLTGTAGSSLNAGVSVGFHQRDVSSITEKSDSKIVYTYGLQRSFIYALNFYFHRELPEWSPENPSPAVVFTSSASLDGMVEMGLKCPSFKALPKVIACQDPGLLNRPRGRGQPQ